MGEREQAARDAALAVQTVCSRVVGYHISILGEGSSDFPPETPAQMSVQIQNRSFSPADNDSEMGATWNDLHRLSGNMITALTMAQGAWRRKASDEAFGVKTFSEESEQEIKDNMASFSEILGDFTTIIDGMGILDKKIEDILKDTGAASQEVVAEKYISMTLKEVIEIIESNFHDLYGFRGYILDSSAEKDPFGRSH